MPTDMSPRIEECACLAVRQAARHITQFYDQLLAPIGLRTTQFSILAKLRRQGPMTINALADELVMDRTTLGRNILPLEREGLISVAPGRTGPSQQGAAIDGRRRRTTASRARGLEGGANAGSRPLSAKNAAVELRALLREVSATDLPRRPPPTARA